MPVARNVTRREKSEPRLDLRTHPERVAPDGDGGVFASLAFDAESLTEAPALSEARQDDKRAQRATRGP